MISHSEDQIVNAPDTAQAGGMIGHLRGLGASLCEHAALRVELAAHEFQDEKRNLTFIAAGILLFCGLALATLVFAGFTAVVLVWDTDWRAMMAIGVFVLLAALTASAAGWLHWQLGRSRHPFSQSIEELRRDAGVLRSLQP